jgi:hypothetical protein
VDADGPSADAKRYLCAAISRTAPAFARHEACEKSASLAPCRPRANGTSRRRALHNPFAAQQNNLSLDKRLSLFSQTLSWCHPEPQAKDLREAISATILGFPH